jgi:hypothetical protein
VGGKGLRGWEGVRNRWSARFRLHVVAYPRMKSMPMAVWSSSDTHLLVWRAGDSSESGSFRLIKWESGMGLRTLGALGSIECVRWSAFLIRHWACMSMNMYVSVFLFVISDTNTKIKRLVWIRHI